MSEYVITVDNTTTTIASNLTTPGAVITKSGPGTLALSGSNSNGAVYVNQGTLAVESAGALDGVSPTLAPNTTFALLSDGDGTGSNQTITTYADQGFTFLGNATLAVGPIGTIPLYKTIEANYGNIISLSANTTLTITNNSGYGLLLGGTVTLPSTGTAATISVANATNSNIVQGLTIAGTLSGGETGAGNVVFYKSGAGTLELTGTGNTFGGGGSVIDVTQGVLAATSDAALGDSNNVIELTPSTGTSAFEALGTFATSRTIEFGATSNTRQIDVSSRQHAHAQQPLWRCAGPNGLSHQVRRGHARLRQLGQQHRLDWPANDQPGRRGTHRQ